MKENVKEGTTVGDGARAVQAEGTAEPGDGTELGERRRIRQ